jgi:hypothetical protein
VTQDHFEELQSLFRIEPENPITLRAIKGRQVENVNFHAADFPDVMDRWAAFGQAALTLNRQGYNIYTCLNPIKPEFAGYAVGDADILCRRLLLVDLDRIGEKPAPATDDEIRLAVEVADEVQASFLARYGEVPTRILSGNGIHLYYRLDDYPNDDASLDAFKRVLQTLASKFNTDAIEVDTSVSNASRITKVPGTIAFKGKATDDRPYRKALFL